MSGPYVWIGSYTIKSGKGDEARELCRKIVELAEEKEPRLISFDVYLDDEATQLSTVQVHPDAESMELHLQVIADHLTDSLDVLGAPVYEHSFGRPTESLTRTLLQWAEPGAPPMTSMPDHVAGFTRSTVAVRG